MIFCDHCFIDREISSIIGAVSGGAKGKCPVCGSNDVFLYDTDLQNDLTPYFEDLISVYSPTSSLPDYYPVAERRTLIDELNDRWSVFSGISRASQYEIITAICHDLYSTAPALFDDLIGISELHDSSYLRDHALLKNSSWEEFVDEIKTKNRYHSKLVNFGILEKYCSFIRKKYKTGDCFYRARISDSRGFPVAEMSAPPAGKSSEGRANARGITCLYVANDIDTTLHEVRAGVFDYVTVGTFQLKRDITIVDLKALNTISPFIEGLDFIDHAINKQYLEKLNFEMSRPLRRSDSTLDYIPTQYIVDFIKSIEHDGAPEYDGIEYNSTTNPGGFNLAIFNPELFQCISVDVYDIEELHYNKKKL